MAVAIIRPRSRCSCCKITSPNWSMNAITVSGRIREPDGGEAGDRPSWRFRIGSMMQCEHHRHHHQTSRGGGRPASQEPASRDDRAGQREASTSCEAGMKRRRPRCGDLLGRRGGVRSGRWCPDACQNAWRPWVFQWFRRSTRTTFRGCRCARAAPNRRAATFLNGQSWSSWSRHDTGGLRFSPARVHHVARASFVIDDSVDAFAGNHLGEVPDRRKVFEQQDIARPIRLTANSIDGATVRHMMPRPEGPGWRGTKARGWRVGWRQVSVPVQSSGRGWSGQRRATEQEPPAKRCGAWRRRSAGSGLIRSGASALPGAWWRSSRMLVTVRA